MRERVFVALPAEGLGVVDHAFLSCEYHVSVAEAHSGEVAVDLLLAIV